MVPPNKGEVCRDIIDSDETTGICRGHGKEEQYRLFHLQEGDREHAIRRSSEQSQGLLHSESDNAQACNDKQCNDAPTIPCVRCAPEIDCHDGADQCRDTEHSAHEVEFPEPLSQLLRTPRVESRKQKNVHRCEQSTNTQVEIKAPTPGGARFGKGAPNDRTNDGANPEDEATVVSPLLASREMQDTIGLGATNTSAK